MSDPGTLVFAAQTGLEPLRQAFPPISQHKTKVEITAPAHAAAADRYVLAVMAWADEAQRALEGQPEHQFAEQLRIIYDDHVGEAAALARLGYGGETAQARFVRTLREDIPRRLRVGVALGLALLVLLALRR